MLVRLRGVGWGGVAGGGGWLAMIEVLPLRYVQMEVASHPHPTPHPPPPISPCDPIIIMKWFGMKVKMWTKGYYACISYNILPA